MKIFNKFINAFSTKFNFDDGTCLVWLHRYALRYIDGDKAVDIGFEISVGTPNCDRVIHADSFVKWNHPFEDVLLSPEERIGILKKVICYCEKKGYRYRTEPSNG